MTGLGMLFGTGVGMIYTVDRVVTLPANRLENVYSGVKTLNLIFFETVFLVSPELLSSNPPHANWWGPRGGAWSR